MAGEMNLRDRKKMKARQMLEDAALDLFERKGFEATTVAEIAHAVDMSPRTFFRYFRSKEDVIFARASSYLSVVRDCLVNHSSDATRFEAVRAVLIDYAASMENRRDRIVRRARIIGAHPQLRARSANEMNIWSEALTEDLATRAGASKATPADRLVASIGLSVLGCAYESWVTDESPEALPEILESRFRTLDEEVCSNR